jgi:hypothetical protein
MTGGACEATPDFGIHYTLYTDLCSLSLYITAGPMRSIGPSCIAAAGGASPPAPPPAQTPETAAPVTESNGDLHVEYRPASLAGTRLKMGLRARGAPDGPGLTSLWGVRVPAGSRPPGRFHLPVLGERFRLLAILSALLRQPLSGEVN